MKKPRKEVPIEVCEMAKSLAKLIHEIDSEKAFKEQNSKKG